MERDSFLYKLRRKIQVTAHHIFSDEFMCQLYSKIVLKHKVNLKSPKTFNDKIQWLKIHDFPNNELVIQCADKYRVREYIKDKGFNNILVPLLGRWDKAEEIDWDSLPQQFVLKCNHGCAYNILCPDKSKFNKAAAISQLRTWLKEDFGAFNIEKHYSKIKPMIIAEVYLGECITDYKFFCFNGVPKFMYVSSDLIHDRQAHIGFFYLDGKKMPLVRNDYAQMNIDELPPFFKEMKQTAEVLCKNFTFVRVDFFLANNTYYFAELTFTPGAGMMPFNPEEYDLKLGEMLDISQEMKSAKN